MKSSEFKRWLAAKGAKFLNGKFSVLPMHSKDLKKGLAEGIKRQLGLKQGEK